MPESKGTDCTILYASKATAVRINWLATSHLNTVFEISPPKFYQLQIYRKINFSENIEDIIALKMDFPPKE